MSLHPSKFRLPLLTGALFALVGSASAALGKPLAFEPNLGQSQSEVAYLGRTSEGTLFLSSAELVLALRESAPATERDLGQPEGRPQSRHHVLRFKPAAAATARLAASQPLPSRSTYFKSGKILDEVPHFGRVTYQGLYPATDLVVRGEDGHWAYDFVLAPGADPRLPAWQIEGATARLEADGTLALDTPLGTVHQSKPYLYQEIGGQKLAIEGGFELRPNGLVGFTVGAYDHRLPLVIDPTISYRTCVGGSNAITQAYGVEVTANGQGYLIGSTDAIDFPHPGGAQGDGFGYDAVVAKLDLAGNLSRATYFDLGGDEYGNGIDLDASNNVAIAGTTWNTSSTNQAFVAKLTPLLDTISWTRVFGGNGLDFTADVEFDTAGNLFAGGSTDSVDFCSGLLAGKCTIKSVLAAGDRDGFLVKLGPNGGISWATLVGTGLEESASAVAVDSSGRPYLGGYTYNPPAGTNPAVFSSWVRRLAANGSATSYAFSFGTTPDSLTSSTINVMRDLAVDAYDNAYVTGFTNSRFLGTVGAVQPTLGGDFDAFVGMINNSGSAFVYLTYLGGSAYESGEAIRVGDSQNAYIAGWRRDTDPNGDAFVARYAAGGLSRVFYTAFGGGFYDAANGLALDSARNLYVAGTTASTDFDPGDPACTAASSVNYLAFLTKVLP